MIEPSSAVRKKSWWRFVPLASAALLTLLIGFTGQGHLLAPVATVLTVVALWRVREADVQGRRRTSGGALAHFYDLPLAMRVGVVAVALYTVVAAGAIAQLLVDVWA